MRNPFGVSALRAVGVMLAVAGLVLLVDCFARFALERRGTPAPVAPTATLVASGPYRYVRNPMYVAVLLIIVGQALLLGSLLLVATNHAVAPAVRTYGTVGAHSPLTMTASPSPGQGGIVTPIAASGASPNDRN